MVSALHLLLRRPPPSHCIRFNNQCGTTTITAARHLATKAAKQAARRARQQARADKLRKDSAKKSNSKKGNDAKKQQSITDAIPKQGGGGGGGVSGKAASKNFKSQQQSAPPPSKSRYAQLPKAPHMQSTSSSSSSGGGGGGIGGGPKEWVSKNPFIFAAFVFPTLTTGILILVKPNLRAQFLGTEVVKENVSVGVPEETPPAAYEFVEVEVEGVGSASQRQQQQQQPLAITEGGIAAEGENHVNIEEEEGAEEAKLVEGTTRVRWWSRLLPWPLRRSRQSDDDGEK